MTGFTQRASQCSRLPANLCTGGADVRRYHPVPANGVGARVHYVWLVNAAVDAETEHVRADAAAPIRLRRGAHGVHGDGTESLFRLVLLDVIASASCARLTAVSLSNPSAVPDRPTHPACAGAPRAQLKPTATNASTEPRTDEIISDPRLA